MSTSSAERGDLDAPVMVLVTLISDSEARHVGKDEKKTKDQPYLCDQCDYRTAHKVSLEAHTLTHGERQFKCSSCDKAYYTPHALKQHEKIHSEAQAHICEHCGKRFGRLSHLERHVRTHLKDRPFQCPECDYAATVNSHLKRHMIVKHSKEERSTCDKCGKSFASAYACKTHMQSHDTAVSCPLCDKIYHTRSGFRSHYRSVHKGIKYQCEFCGDKFTQRCGLTYHLRAIHLELRTFTCEHCDYRAVAKSSVTDHMKRVHGSE